MSATKPRILYEAIAADHSQPPESVTSSGIIVTSFSALYGELRSWVKIRGEAAQTLYCTPDQFRAVWQEYRKLNDRNAVIAACDFTYGLPLYYFHHIIEELVHVGVTHQPKERAKPAPGGIWMSDWSGPASGVWIEA